MLKKDYKNWPSQGSRFLECTEYGYFTLLFCGLLYDGKEMNKEL